MLASPVQTFPQLSSELGVELLVKRDDLLPFPLAGNKVRKLAYELASLGSIPEVVISTGSVDSNHCRTIAWMAAERGFRASLVLHGGPGRGSNEKILEALGAECHFVEPSEIATTIELLQQREARRGTKTHVISGGCHTPAGVAAYRDAARELLSQISNIDLIVVATGTGATHAGIALGTADSSPTTRVLGISVARGKLRAEASVHEAVSWMTPDEAHIQVDDRFIDGGYGQHSPATRRVVTRAWRSGLPLDPVYTGKAFRGLIAACQNRTRNFERVLFWHTGGLVNWLGQGERDFHTACSDDDSQARTGT